MCCQRTPKGPCRCSNTALETSPLCRFDWLGPRTLAMVLALAHPSVNNRNVRYRWVFCLEAEQIKRVPEALSLL